MKRVNALAANDRMRNEIFIRGDSEGQIQRQWRFAIVDPTPGRGGVANATARPRSPKRQEVVRHSGTGNSFMKASKHSEAIHQIHADIHNDKSGQNTERQPVNTLYNLFINNYLLKH